MKITKGQITIDGVLYKAFHLTGKMWMVVRGDRFDSPIEKKWIEARSAKQALEIWLESRKS